MIRSVLELVEGQSSAPGDSFQTTGQTPADLAEDGARSGSEPAGRPPGDDAAIQFDLDGALQTVGGDRARLKELIDASLDEAPRIWRALEEASTRATQEVSARAATRLKPRAIFHFSEGSISLRSGEDRGGGGSGKCGEGWQKKALRNNSPDLLDYLEGNNSRKT